MDRAAAPLNHRAVTPYTSIAGAQRWIALAMAGSLVWGDKTKRIKKQRDRGGVGLRWLPFGQKRQQSTNSWQKQWKE
jgi:hypothetical protein